MLGNYREELTAGESPPSEGRHLWSYHGAPTTVQSIGGMFEIEYTHNEHGHVQKGDIPIFVQLLFFCSMRSVFQDKAFR
jgi:hypothetical protein